jgi:transcriptional regulator with XRE-family HTH domain
MIEERARLGLTQAEVAEIGKVTRRTQINYENGERSPDASYFRLLDKKGLDSLYVITGRREPSDADFGVAENKTPYEVKGLKPANVRAACMLVFNELLTNEESGVKTKSPKKTVDANRVAEAIIVLAEMSESAEDVKQNASHVLRLLR